MSRLAVGMLSIFWSVTIFVLLQCVKDALNNTSYESSTGHSPTASHGNFVTTSQMEKIKQVFTILRQNNYDPIVKTKNLKDNQWNQLIWTDEKGDECAIDEDNIAIEENKIAWFQSNERDNHLLKIYESGIEFAWTPLTYNPVFGCLCLLIEWYKKHLLFIYHEKHDIYICIVENETVKHFNFSGYEIGRKDDLISYETYTNNLPNKVRLIKIPELVELEPIDKSEAERVGLLPLGLERPENSLFQ